MLKEKSILSEKNYLMLLLSSGVSSFGDWVQKISLTIFFFKATGSAFDVSLYFLITTLPDVILAPAIGIVIDRFNKKGLLVISEIMQGILVLSLLLVKEKTLFMTIIFISSIFKYTSMVASQAIIPEVIDKNKLIRANSLIRMSSSSMRIVGPAVGGILTTLFSINTIFIFNAVTFFISTIFYTFIDYRYNSSVVIKKEQTNDKAEKYIECISYFTRNKIIFYTTLFLSVALFVSGPVNVLIIKYISQKFNDESIYGIFISSMGIGYICGGLLLNIFSNIKNKFHILALIIFIDGIFNFTIIGSNQYFIVVLALLFGIINCIFNVLDETIIQEYTSSDYMGRVFSIHNVFLDSSYLISTFIAGLASEYIILESLYISSGVILVFSSIIYFVAIKNMNLCNREVETVKIQR